MKIENIPAEIKSKSLKEAKDEINEILLLLESKNLDLSDSEDKYKRLINLNKVFSTHFFRSFNIEEVKNCWSYICKNPIL